MNHRSLQAPGLTGLLILCSADNALAWPPPFSGIYQRVHAHEHSLLLVSAALVLTGSTVLWPLHAAALTLTLHISAL